MKLVGIDLGTTNSAIAIVNEFGKAEIVPNKEGERITPSVVLFDDDQIIVGSIAKQSAVADPDNTVSFIKSQMGSPDFKFIYNEKEFSPEDISAMILRKLIDDAENYLEEKITDIVLTVPAYFNDKQRKATIDAGRIAGVNVSQIINEPTAAALTYGVEKKQDDKIIVYDLGGGTFDVTIMHLREDHFDVIASDGDRNLGGNDFDDKLMNYLNDNFKKEHGIDLLEDPIQVQDLRLKAENAKKILSSKKNTTVYLSAQGKSAKIDLDREIFSELVADLVTRTEMLLEAVMADANLDWGDLDHILLVGGSTRMPVIQKMIKRVTGKEPLVNINPDEAIALGAAIQTGIISAKNKDSEISDMVRMKYSSLNVSDVTSHSFGAVTLDEYNNKKNAIIIPKNSKIPIRKSQIFYTTIPDQTSVKLTVLQGEDPDPEFCSIVGTTILEFPPKRLNSPIIFNYEYDVNGIIHCTAKDPDTEKKSVVNISREGELGGSEVRMKEKQLNSLIPKRRDYETVHVTENSTHLDLPSADFKEAPVKNAAKMVSDIFDSRESKTESIMSQLDNVPKVENRKIIEKAHTEIEKIATSIDGFDDGHFEKNPPQNEVVEKEVSQPPVSSSKKEILFDEEDDLTIGRKDEALQDNHQIEPEKKENSLSSIQKSPTQGQEMEMLIDRSEILTDAKIERLIIDENKDEETSLDFVSKYDSSILEDAVTGLESVNTNDWEKVLKMMELDGGTNVGEDNPKETRSKKDVEENFLELESDLENDFNENQKDKKAAKGEKGQSNDFISSNGDLMDWILDDDE